MLRVNAINRQELLKCLTFNPKSLVFKTVSVDCLRYTIKVIETLHKADSLDYFAMLRGWEMCRNDALK